MKRVAVVACAFPPMAGGIGNNAYYHAKRLAELDYQVTVFTPRYLSSIGRAPLNFKAEYLPVFWPIGKAGFLFSLFKKLKNFDIIHFYYPFFGTDLIVWLFKIFNREKKLVLHYEMDPVGQGIMKIIFWFYLKLFLGWLIRISDKIIVLSWDHAGNSYLKKYIEKYQSKFVEIPNGVDTEIFQPIARNENLARQYNIGSEDKMIIFVGGLDRQHYFKGVKVLLKAFKRITVSNCPPLIRGDDSAEGGVRGVEENVLPLRPSGAPPLIKGRYKLLMVGDGDLRPYYEKLAADLGIKNNVIFTGWVKNEELPRYYNLADIFVLPSTARTESFGIVIAEAQACGLPVIVSNWPGSRETLKEGETGLLVKPGDIDDLAEKLLRLLGDDELRKKMAGGARERAAAMYDWDSVIRKIDEMYNSL